ncbi:hypothetical protein GCM10009123_03480 [Kangiella japonica]|uniref:Uncharacterized protein n=1 Tax=Kangiella japonica TaxID=647384 RepID=A0ABP3CDJ7_9GAMM
MLAKNAISLSNEDMSTINSALDEFERSLSSIERDSQDAFALAIL